MNALLLELLGTLQVTSSGQTVTRFRTSKVPALLAYLAVEARQPHCRSVLAGLLWPEKPESAALSNLRYTLFHLRTAIGDRQAEPPFLLIHRDAIQFNPASDHRLDVDEFHALLGAVRLPGSEPVVLPRAGIDTLKSAVALYRGPFLEGFSLQESSAFEEWMLHQRERLHCQVLDALQRLAVYYEMGFDYSQAEHYTRRYLDLEPWEERAHRRLMRLLALRGRRNAALAQYHACRGLLGDELGLEPETETRTLYECIRVGELEGLCIGQPAPVLVAPAWPTAGPFVGRERELATLDGFLDRALAGQGRVALVAGSTGSGKTALLRAFGRRAMQRHPGLVVAMGSCTARAGSAAACLPFYEILQMLVGTIEPWQMASVLSPDHASRLCRLQPTVVQALVEAGPDLIGDLVPAASRAWRMASYAPCGTARHAQLGDLVGRACSTAPPGQSEAARFRQLTRVLQTVARHQPLVLLLDDLQWIDDRSIGLLFHLSRRLAGSRLLLVGAYRPLDLALGHDEAPHPLQPILHEFHRDFGAVQVDLDDVDGRSFVDVYLDAQPNALREPFRERLYRATAANALFIVEMVREMQERGCLVRDAAGRWVEGAAPDWAYLSPRVEAAIAGQFGPLPSVCQQTLIVASVEGEAFTAEVAARVQRLDDETVLRHLSGPLSEQCHLVVAQGVRWVAGRRLSSYRFRHNLLQKYLYGRLDAVARAHLHAAVGHALDALYRDDAVAWAALSPRLALHFAAAGAASRAAV